MRNLPDLVIPFKRAVYERVVDAFAHLVRMIPKSGDRFSEKIMRKIRSGGAFSARR